LKAPKRFDEAIYLRSKEAIAHGALTNSKRPECLVRRVYPTHLTIGRGAYVWDTYKNRYIDYICGLGANILGYGHEEVTAAITAQAMSGCTLSLGSAIEVETAEKVKEIFPFVERVRFLKTGSDACEAAIRIARTKTGRKWVLSEGYHGHGSEFVALTPPAQGIAIDSWVADLNGPIEHDWDSVAAIILEPVNLDATPGRAEKLKFLRQKCDRHGVALIFDEIITGFRFPRMSVAGYFGIEPDLICLGKAMANGMPLSVVGGRASFMESGEYFISSTFAGETLSLAAGLKTMTLLQTKYDMTQLWDAGAQFLKDFNLIWPDGIRIEGYPTRGRFDGSEMIKALFWQESVKSGILFGPSWFYNFDHIPLRDTVISTSRDILTRIRLGSVKLEGDLPTSPFAAKMRRTA
jgi:glutamate-1-semialdehyde 2,1-aminomutase